MATNSHVIYVRGLTAGEHAMLSALASNSSSRTVNGFMLEVIRELLDGGRLRAELHGPKWKSRISREVESWILPGSPEGKALREAEAAIAASRAQGTGEAPPEEPSCQT